MEKTLRTNGKWAKISGKRGCWTLAQGWSGNFKAAKLRTYPTKDGALIAGRYWVND
jgi:hypothetical protein